MAFTQQDLDAVNKAILDLVTGLRKTTVTFSSDAGNRSVTYQQAGLRDLKSVRSEIERYLNSQAGSAKKRIARVTTIRA